MNETADVIKEIDFPKSESETSPPEESAATVTGSIVAVAESVTGHVGNFRWVICALLFFAATINYMDRQIIAVLKPTLQTEFNWSEIDYGWIVFSFQSAYAIGLLFVGRLMDKIGTKKGFSLSVVVWSISAIGHAIVIPIGLFVLPVILWFTSSIGYTTTTVLSASVIGFIIARFALGIGESGNWPASVKTVAEWFPKKERALATGLFNSGINIGALATPLVVPIIVAKWGWQEAFVFTGLIGFIWLVFWLIFYRRPEEHPRLSKEEFAYIQSDPQQLPIKISWRKLFPYRQTWAFAVGKFLTDPIWYMFLFWLPDFLKKQHGLDLKSFGIPLAVIYIISDMGSIAGGYLSSTLIKRGWTINKSRKIAMLVCALSVVPIVFASMTSKLWVAVLLIGLATAAHQGWSANLFTLTSDMFPKQAIGSVVGIGGMAGAVGGMLIAPLIGFILDKTGNYFLIFVIAASAYLTAFLFIQLLTPRLESASFYERESKI